MHLKFGEKNNMLIIVSKWSFDDVLSDFLRKGPFVLKKQVFNCMISFLTLHLLRLNRNYKFKLNFSILIWKLKQIQKSKEALFVECAF